MILGKGGGSKKGMGWAQDRVQLVADLFSMRLTIPLSSPQAAREPSETSHLHKNVDICSILRRQFFFERGQWTLNRLHEHFRTHKFSEQLNLGKNLSVILYTP